LAYFNIRFKAAFFRIRQKAERVWEVSS